MGHGPAHHARQCGQPYLRIGTVVGANEHSVQPLDELLKRPMVRQQADEDRVELQGVGRVPVFDGVIDDPFEEQFAPPIRRFLGLGGCQRVVQFGEFHLRDGDDDVVLGLELMVDSTFRDADRVGDHPVRRRADTVFGEKLERGVEDALLCRAAVGSHPARVYDRLGDRDRADSLRPMGLRGLAGKVAVVAGGATGIGAATAKRLAEEGCTVVVGDVAADGARRTVDEITAGGGTAAAVTFDLAEPESVLGLFNAAADAYGGVDAAFNVGADMAALRGDTDVVDIDLDLWDRVMAVNLRGYVVAMKAAIPLMLACGGGAIVNMSSAAAFQGEPTRPAYATAKAGIGALTRHVASRWGKDGIRCNAVAPGFTATEAIRSVPQWPDLQAAALKRIRGDRVGSTEDIASLVAFLVSSEGEWINGQVINIDGGTVLR